MSKVGFIGVGVMGMPMARNLIRGGHRVRAFDVDSAALEAIGQHGAAPARSARDAALGADFVITMLPTGDHVAKAVFGESGIAGSLGRDSLLIDMSTGLPAHFDATARRLESEGSRMIDAPVGRTSREAEEGTLLIMVGGDPEDVSRARPVLECMGDTIVHCGPAGAGIRTKLVNNYLSIVSNVVVAEALAIAEGAGVDREVAIEVLMGTTAGRGHLATTYPAKVLADDLEPGFMVDLARKDLGLALQMSAESDSSRSMGIAAIPFYESAQEQGMGRKDWTAVYNLVRDKSGA
ncbi:MAG: sulfolactaldehyde 3-reductase [bacterium]|nr:sulfolactaldehyde 3-reductase [bacterium]MDE0439051.1 sulfolactaldehyde 3-reductase [bacterium]